MPEMSGVYERIKVVHVYSPNGNFLGCFELATDDPDPTASVAYVAANGREFAIMPRRDGAYVARDKDAGKLRLNGVQPF